MLSEIQRNGYLASGDNRSMDGDGKPVWWPEVLGVKGSKNQAKGAGEAQQELSGKESADASSAEQAASLPGADSSTGTGIELQQGSGEAASNGSWIRQVDNSSWVEQVEEFYMEDDSAEEAVTPAAMAASPTAEDTRPEAPAVPAAAPAPSGPLQRVGAAVRGSPAHIMGVSADPEASNASAASAVAASPAPAADSSEAAEPAWMHRVVAGGKLFVSEATLTWEQLAETSVEEAQDAVQQDRVIEQEKASSDGSEVEAFGEVYSAGDVAGVSLDPADNPPALAPAPAPEHAPDPCAAALGVPKVHQGSIPPDSLCLVVSKLLRDWE
jgi:hypothetical protein